MAIHVLLSANLNSGSLNTVSPFSHPTPLKDWYEGGNGKNADKVYKLFTAIVFKHVCLSQVPSPLRFTVEHLGFDMV